MHARLRVIVSTIKKMFNNDRSHLRKTLINAWQHRFDTSLDFLQQKIIALIQMHLEYHEYFSEKYIDHDYLPEYGQTNPFLHIALHLSLEEQIDTNRPAGIQALYKQLLQKHPTHQTQHLMMDVLAECLWEAQKNNVLPDEKKYLDLLEALLLK